MRNCFQNKRLGGQGKVFMLGLVLLLALFSMNLVSAFNWTDGTLVSYWKLDEASGKVLDVLNLNNGTNNGATPNLVGKINKTYSFDGNDYINISNSSSLRIAGSMSLVAWANLSNSTTSERTIVGKYSTASGHANYYLSINNGNIPTARVYSSPSALGIECDAVYSLTSDAVSNNSWHQYVLTFNSTSKILTFYVDGVYKNSTTLNYAYLCTNMTASAMPPMGIGSIKISAWDSNFTGEIDEVAIFNKTLSQFQIAQLNNGSSGIPYGTGDIFGIRENSVNYSSQAYHSDTNNYLIINITNTTYSYTSINATLVYNGTVYPTTKETDSKYTKFNTTIDIGTNYGIKYFFWNFTLVNATGTYYSSSLYYPQEILDIDFGICNSTLTSKYINFTFKDEGSLSVLNATIPSSTFYYWINNQIENKTYTFTNNTANYDYSFCFTPNTKNISIDMNVQYASEGYPQRVYDPNTINFTTTTPTNTTLYLLGTADGIYVTFQVVNPANQRVEGALITITREILGATVTIGSGTTGSDGTYTFWLNPDYLHDITVNATGYSSYVASIYPTQSSYTISLGGTSIADTDYTKGISWNIYPSNNYLNNGTTYNFNYTTATAYWEIEEFGFTLENENGIIYATTSAVTNGGIVSVNLNTKSNETIKMKYYYIVNGTYQNFTRSWSVIYLVGEEWSLSKFFEDIQTYSDTEMFGMTPFTLAVLSFLIIFITTGLLSYQFSVTNAGVILFIASVMIIFFDVGLGFLPNVGEKHLLSWLSVIISMALFFREGLK